MKLKITERGVFGHEVGAIIDVDGDTIPDWLVNKAVKVDAETVAVTNPAEGAIVHQVADSAAERQELLAAAAIQIAADAFNDDGVPDVRAINAELADDTAKFTAAERDRLWPGIAADVTASRG